MIKKLFFSALTLLLVFSITSSAEAVLPADLEAQINATKRERDSLVEEQRRLEAELNALNKESQTLGNAVKSLDTTRKKIQNDINITKSKINNSNLSIRSLESTISEKERQILTHEDAIATGIKMLAEYDSRSLLAEVLLDGQISDIWRDRAVLSDLSLKLKDEILNLRQTRKNLNQEKLEKEKKKKDLESFQNQLAGQRSVVEENQNTKQKLLNRTKSEEAAYQKILQDNLERQRQSEQDIYELEQQLRITLDPSLFPDPKKGIISWPLDEIYITQNFGKTIAGKRLYASGFHNGMDFRASMGTAVRSVSNGVVLGTDNTDKQRGCYSYGLWILVKHDNGLASIYSHLSSSIVKTGQRVEEGQVIGYSGGYPGSYGAGYSTGPHLHFGLFASQGVEISQFTTSRGCKQVSIPIAKGVEAYLDPLAYLPKL